MLEDTFELLDAISIMALLAKIEATPMHNRLVKHIFIIIKILGIFPVEFLRKPTIKLITSKTTTKAKNKSII